MVALYRSHSHIREGKRRNEWCGETENSARGRDREKESEEKERRRQSTSRRCSRWTRLVTEVKDTDGRANPGRANPRYAPLLARHVTTATSLQLEPRAVTGSHRHGPPPTLGCYSGWWHLRTPRVRAPLSLSLFSSLLFPSLPPSISLSRSLAADLPCMWGPLVPASPSLSLSFILSFSCSLWYLCECVLPALSHPPPLSFFLSRVTVRREANADSTVHRRAMPTPPTAVPTRG